MNHTPSFLSIHAGELLTMGVNIHLYRGKFLHAKHLSIDDSMCLLGSSNLDIRSFHLNAESSLVVYDRAVTAALQVEQARTLAQAQSLRYSRWRQRPFAIKVLENWARLLSPLL